MAYLENHRKDESINMPEGSLTKRSDGRWMGRYYDGPKQKCVYARTKKECATKLAQAIKDRNENKDNNVVDKKMKFGIWWERWNKTYKGHLKKSSQILNERYYNYHIKDKFEKKEIGKITSIFIQEFLNDIDSKSSREKCFNLLNQTFRKLVDIRVLAHNPMRGVDLIITNCETTSARQAITFEEEKLILDSIKDHWIYNLVRLVLYTGLRRGEALALTWDDIDFENMIITVNKSYDRYTKKVTSPKTKTATRTVPIFNNTLEVLNSIEKSAETNELFHNFSKNNVGELLRKLFNKLKLPKVSLHNFRHTFATRCLEAGIHEKVVQTWLGHANYQTTIDTYSHIQKTFETNEINKMERYFDTHFDTCLESNKNLSKQKKKKTPEK